jgi:hypothetical protein
VADGKREGGNLPLKSEQIRVQIQRRTLSAAHKKVQGGYASIRKIDAIGKADATYLQ